VPKKCPSLLIRETVTLYGALQLMNDE